MAIPLQMRYELISTYTKQRIIQFYDKKAGKIKEKIFYLED